MKFFYTHLISIETMITALDEFNLSGEQKRHLAHLVDSSIHTTVLNLVLNNLEEKEKSIFLDLLQKRDHDKIWKLLKQKVENIEEKIKKETEDLTMQLHKDLKEAKSIKGKR